jgi:serine/threonine-protein kinase HipA
VTSELVTLLGDTEVGRVRRDRHGRLSFVYDEKWRRARRAYPTSLSMPLALAEHGHRVVDAFLWGLLPDNELIIERWARRFQVSARSAFALMAHVGEDCAGAIRFATRERLPELMGPARGSVEWLDGHGVAERLRALRSDASAWRRETDAGQFSLAGAQPKTALFFDGTRWGVPSGRIPTTHVLKPGTPNLDGHAENEHFCLSLAAELGLPVARSRVVHFEDQVAIVVERYDRLRTPAGLIRVHQEDACQALAIHPGNKYENDGGPGALAVVELLREHSRSPAEDIDVFLQALVFNWLIGGTDAHAKNYSLLIGEEARARLAPLYDLASALPYARTQEQKLRMAMKVGGKYRMRDIGPHQWGKFAIEARLDEHVVKEHLQRILRVVPDLCSDLLKRARSEGLTHPVVGQLAAALVERAKRNAQAAL